MPGAEDWGAGNDSTVFFPSAALIVCNDLISSTILPCSKHRHVAFYYLYFPVWNFFAVFPSLKAWSKTWRSGCENWTLCCQHSECWASAKSVQLHGKEIIKQMTWFKQGNALGFGILCAQMHTRRGRANQVQAPSTCRRMNGNNFLFRLEIRRKFVPHQKGVELEQLPSDNRQVEKWNPKLKAFNVEFFGCWGL